MYFFQTDYSTIIITTSSSFLKTTIDNTQTILIWDGWLNAAKSPTSAGENPSVSFQVHWQPGAWEAEGWVTRNGNFNW